MRLTTNLTGKSRFLFIRNTFRPQRRKVASKQKPLRELGTGCHSSDNGHVILVLSLKCGNDTEIRSSLNALEYFDHKCM